MWYINHNTEHLLDIIYKLLLKYDSESEQVDNCMIQWTVGIAME